MTSKNKIKVLLFKGRGPLSFLIRWKTNSIYSHAAILLPDGETIIESWQGAGVRKKVITDWEGIDSYDVDLTNEQAIGIIKYLENKVGLKYDYLGVLGIALNKPYQKKSRYFCFELVFEAFEFVGIKLLSRTKARECTGGLLMRSNYLK